MVSAAAKVGGAPIPTEKTCLRSWKEIAIYAQVSVATVQRWEKEELMPVHRHMHARRDSVYAYTVEIEEWLHRRDTLLAKRATLIGSAIADGGLDRVGLFSHGQALDLAEGMASGEP